MVFQLPACPHTRKFVLAYLIADSWILENYPWMPKNSSCFKFPSANPVKKEHDSHVKSPYYYLLLVKCSPMLDTTILAVLLTFKSKLFMNDLNISNNYKELVWEGTYNTSIFVFVIYVSRWRYYEGRLLFWVVSTAHAPYSSI